MGLIWDAFRLVSVIIGIYVTNRLLRYTRGRELPGPRGVPLIGNVFQNPKEREWLQYTTWSKQYGLKVYHILMRYSSYLIVLLHIILPEVCNTGSIYKLKLLQQTVIIVNSLKATTDLLEKRSTIYSDRPRLVMAGEL
jgi:hypothetical protein